MNQIKYEGVRRGSSPSLSPVDDEPCSYISLSLSTGKDLSTGIKQSNKDGVFHFSRFLSVWVYTKPVIKETFKGGDLLYRSVIGV